MGDRVQELAVEPTRDAVVRFAQTNGAFYDRFEDRLRVGRRAADDLEDFGRRGLPLQRLPGLVEQAHVLDRDHGLRGERLDQRDVSLVENLRFVMRGTDGADHLAIAQHGREDHGIESEIARELLGSGGRRGIVDDRRILQGLLHEHRQATDGALVERARVALDQLLETRLAVDRRHVDDAVAQNLDHREARAEQAQQVAHDCIENGPGIGHRTADGCEDFRGCGLLLQRLLGLVVRMAQLLFGALALRDVAGRTDQLGGPAIRAANGNAAVVHPAILAMRVARAHLVFQIWRVPLQVFDHRLPVCGMVLRVDVRVPFRALERAGREAPELPGPVGQVQVTRVDDPFVDPLRRHTGRQGIAFVALLESVLGALQFGDVAGGSDHPDRAPARVARRDSVLPRPVPGVVKRTEAIVAFKAVRAPLEVFHQRVVVFRPVVGMNSSAPVLRRAVGLRRHSECRVHSPGVVDGPVGKVPVIDPLVDGAHRDVVALLALPQAFLGVAQRGGHRRDSPRIVNHAAFAA